jgi:gliding motility-associated-like protein
MKKLITPFLLLLFLVVNTPLFAQPMEVVNNDPFTPQNLITNIFLGEGVEVINVQFDGEDNAVAFFQDAEDEIGISRGLVMSTGNASTQSGPVGVDNVGGVQSSSGTSGGSIDDADVNTIANENSPFPIDHFDVVRYTITFIPISDTLRFNYVFGSEEYPEYACSAFNDIFGFFISGPGISGPFENNAINIAKIPGTDLDVRINNVNPGVVGANGTLDNCTPPLGTLDYSQYYNANTGTNNQPVFDGFTDVFTAEAVVIPCSTYTIKLVIADISDGGWDSGVFLEAKSFGTGSLDVEATTLSLDGSVAEGCGEGLLSFVLPVNVESDFPIDYTIIGTAENGVDYEFIPPDLFIPAGDSIVSVPIIAFEDGIDEGVETILIDIQRDPCNRDTIIIPIRENPLVPAELRPDTSICQGDSLQLDGTLDVPLPPPLTFFNDEPLVVTPAMSTLYSDIDVFGVLPANLQAGVIESVCIEDLQTTWADDLKIYLFSPSGQFMELVTDIGNPGDNFIGTCFVPTATNPITDVTLADQPFTGTFAAEGVWEDLYGSDQPTNGTWQLSLYDKFAADVPILNSWSITFRPVYEISYEWQPAAGLSCTDCPDPIATPDSTTTYVMTATDSYGCTTTDSVVVEVIPILEQPEASCGVITDNSITIEWDPIPGALGYEVNVDDMGWIPANGIESHIVNGLNLSTTVDFLIRAIGECPGAIDTLQCATPDCIPPSLNVANTTSVSCYNGDDGSVTLSAMGGTAPYFYFLGSASNNTGVFTGLEAGEYTGQVIDDIGCPQSVVFNITQPDSLEATLVKSDANCVGSLDGTATYEITGGAAPFQFVWSDGQMDSIAVGLSAGSYGLDITDANGCTFNYNIEILQPDTLQATVDVDSVLCFGENTGSAIVTPTGGVAPYNYTFNPTGTAGMLEGQLLDLVQGNYAYTVTDANNCTFESSFVVEEPPLLEVQVSPTDALCADSTSGAATAIVTGGMGTYTYSWQDDTMTEVSDQDMLDNAGAGNYALVLEDANGCIVNEPFSINEPVALSYSLDTTAATCNGIADGSATITPSGGTGMYSFNWNDIGDGPSNRNDLASGSYEVTISDANGCILPLSFDINSPASILLSFDSTSTSCFQGADGTATVMATGGTLPYSYSWEGGQSDPTAIDLSAGLISVTVSDANGCIAEGNVSVDEAPALSLDLDGTDASCFEGSDGSILASGDGGTGPIGYEWSDGQLTATASGLNAGTYSVTITDANGCTLADTLAIGEASELTTTTDSETATCNPTPDGSASVIPDGGTSPYQYLWSDGQTTATATSLNADEYYVTVTDDNGCMALDTVLVDGIPPIELSATSEDASCNGNNDGQAIITAVGGFGNYSYQWGDGLSDSPAQSNLLAGEYIVTVSDDLGCEATISILIDEPAELTLNTMTEMVRCSGGADGSAEVQIFGGTQPYTILWSNGDTTSQSSELALGTYQVNVSDANGCTASTSVFVDEASPIGVSIEVEEVACFGDRTGSARVLVDGGVAPYTYQWSEGTNSGNEITNAAGGEYTVTITDAAGCEILEELFIPQPDEPLAATIIVTDVSCYGALDGRIEIEATGGTPGYRYSLDGEFFSGSSTFLALEADAYGVLVQDANGCMTLLDAVVVNEPDPIIVDLGEDRSINFGDTIRLTAEITGGIGAFGYDWFPQDTSLLSCFECSGPLVFLTFQQSFSVIVTDETGCTGEDIVTLYAKKNRPVLVPTGFSPNGDNQNDLLLVHAREDIALDVLYYRIFDRWGELLFEVNDFQPNDPAFGWDGTFRGEPLNSGVYLWHVGVKYIDGLEEDFKGHTTLIR